MEMLDYLAWGATILLVSSFIPQIWRIHVHKEVRDLSPVGFSMLFLGTLIHFLYAVKIGDMVFASKHFATLFFVAVILFQMWLHWGDRWKK